MPNAKVSWLLCIGRLVSKTDNVMHFARLVEQASVTRFCDLFVYGAYNYLEDPRIIQDYSFYLLEGYMPEGSPLPGYQLLFSYYYLAPMESFFYRPLQLLGDNKLN